MKLRFLRFVLLIRCLTVSGFAEKLTVEVKGIKNTNGQIKVGVYNKAAGFPDFEQCFMGKHIKPISKTSNVVEFDVPAGTYAVAVMHDENGNGKMDRRKILKIPKEPYGFSNNVRGKIGPPSFEKAAFVVDGKEVTVAITVK